MSLIEEFKKFALRGNMIDLAIGFTVGAAFTTVVKSMVNDLIMPPIGLATGGRDFSDLFWVLKMPEGESIPEGGFATLQNATEAGAVTMNFGSFANNCLSFSIIAVAMFLIIRGVNLLDKQLDKAFGEEPPKEGEPSDKKCEFCRTTISYRATRCPNCTSELAMPPEQVAAQHG